MDNAGQARPHEEVMKELMDPGRSKSEHEHAAAKEIIKLRDALMELTEPRGAYSTDRLTHAENIIEDVISTAKTALGMQP